MSLRGNRHVAGVCEHPAWQKIERLCTEATDGDGGGPRARLREGALSGKLGRELHGGDRVQDQLSAFLHAHVTTHADTGDRLTVPDLKLPLFDLQAAKGAEASGENLGALTGLDKHTRSSRPLQRN